MFTSSMDFNYIQKLVYEHSAIVIELGKEYLVESRLSPLAIREGFCSIEEMILKLRSQPYTDLHRKVVEAMTINETSFFRDIYPFELLKNRVIPELLVKRSSERKLNIWCAACSTGQEPYTIAMLLQEHFPLLVNWNVQLIASDLSQDMISRAQEGRYNQIEVNRGLSTAFLLKYFHKQNTDWQINDEIRHAVKFQEINLASSWPFMANMDIIFMRNVMIYFDIATKKSIFNKVKQILKPDGYLFLGAAETTMNIDDSFENIYFDKAGYYRLKESFLSKRL